MSSKNLTIKIQSTADYSDSDADFLCKSSTADRFYVHVFLFDHLPAARTISKRSIFRNKTLHGFFFQSADCVRIQITPEYAPMVGSTLNKYGFIFEDALKNASGLPLQIKNIWLFSTFFAANIITIIVF